MKTNTSKTSFVFRSLLVLPLTALLLLGFAEKRQIEIDNSADQIIGLEGNVSPSDLGTYNQLAKKYNARSNEIGNYLVSSGVANNIEDVNTVMLTGFYHAYGPINQHLK